MKNPMLPFHGSALPLLFRCRASGAHRLKLNTGNEYSKGGTAFHSMIEAQLRGDTIEVEKIALRVGIEKEEAWDLYYLAQKVKISGIENYEVTTERRYTVNSKMEPCDESDPDAFLTCRLDLMLQPKENPSLVTLMDHKSGFLEQDEAADNLQLIGNAITLSANIPEVRSVDAQLIYPRLEKLSRRVDREGHPQPFTREEIRKVWWPVVRDIILEAVSPEAEYTTGTHCSNCDHLSCPAWRGQMENVLSDPSSALAVQDGGELASDKFLNALSVVPVIEKLCTALRERAKMTVFTTGKAIVFRDGSTFEMRSEPRDTILGMKAMSILDGDDLAEETFKASKVTKSALGTACKVKGKDFEAIMAKLKAGGAVETGQIDKYIFKDGKPKAKKVS